MNMSFSMVGMFTVITSPYFLEDLFLINNVIYTIA